MTPRVLLFLSLLASAFPAPAITVRTSIRGGGESVAVLTARRVDGLQAEPIQQELHVPGTAAVQLGEGTWELQVAAESFWSERVFVQDRDPEAAIELLPLVALHGETNVSSGLRVRFTPLRDGAATGESDCTIEERRWSCGVPVGVYDLRFTAGAFAPEFRWGVEVAKPADLGKLGFVAGASLVGRVTLARGVAVAVENTHVSLRAAGGGKQAYDAKPNRKGFFQFRGVAPGEYVVHGRGEGVTSTPTTVRVIEGRAAELTEPLLLDRPKRLTITLLPTLDPAGKPWRVSFGRSEPGGRNRFETLADSAASAQGEWTHPSLSAGTYSYDVIATSGDIWKSGDVTIESEDVAIAVGVLAQKVTGEVHLGEHPLAARLHFGGENGVALESDADGRFSGVIPPSEKRQWRVLVESDTPDVRRTVTAEARPSDSEELRVDIRLPGTVISGKTVNEDGSPEPHAILTLSPVPHVALPEQTFSDSAGSFQIHGYEPGSYELTAEGFEKESGRVAVTVTEDAAPEVEIVLHPQPIVRGRVFMNDVPVIGARIVAWPLGARGAFLPNATTDERGRFTLYLPAGTTAYDVFAVHPAFESVIARAEVQKDRNAHLHINVKQNGGTLAITPLPQKDEVLWIGHGGGEIPVPLALNEGGGTIDGDRIVIPRLEPGAYTVCSRPANRCVSGFVPPNGIVTLAF